MATPCTTEAAVELVEAKVLIKTWAIPETQPSTDNTPKDKPTNIKLTELR